jgi:hypothetical protein
MWHVDCFGASEVLKSMDIEFRSKPLPHKRHLFAQTAIESLSAMGIVSMVTIFGVHALCRFAGMPSPFVAIAGEQLLWFLPTFVYLWAMFYMIEIAR